MSGDERFGLLIEKILEHARYGPAMDDAVQRRVPLVLNYHSHTGQGTYCVSICEKQEGAIELLDVGLGNLRELVHVEGFGPSEAECIPLCSDLSRALSRHYGLEQSPLIYLEGKPVAESNGGAAR